MPLPRGSESATHETGFLSGSAGAAYVLLHRYLRDRDPADLATARRLLDWVNGLAVADPSGGLRWPVADDDPSSVTGFELGAAGIAWVNLEAARLTGDAGYRDLARSAGIWLRHAQRSNGTWHELPGDGSVGRLRRSRRGRGGDRLGARGPCAREARCDREPARPPASALAGSPRRRGPRPTRCVLVRATAVERPRPARAEPSWHWGSAGIAALRRPPRRGGPGGAPAASSPPTAAGPIRQAARARLASSQCREQRSRPPVGALRAASPRIAQVAARRCARPRADHVADRAC